MGAAPGPAAAAGSCVGAASVRVEGAAFVRGRGSCAWRELRRQNLTKNFKFLRKFIKNLTLKVKFLARISEKATN